MAPVTRWIHLEQLGGDPWILPIWAAVNEAVRAGRAQPVTPELGELAIHLSTRLNLLPWIARRANEGAYSLYRAASNCSEEHQSTPSAEGIALRVDDDVKYSLLADLDSLLFELNAVCESMLKLFKRVHAHAGVPMPKKSVGTSLRHVLEQAGDDPSWFLKLNTHRNFFSHEGAPYAAIDTSRAPDDYDLLILKQNVKSFDDPKTFLRLSEIGGIVNGFNRSRQVLQQHLRGLFL